MKKKLGLSNKEIDTLQAEFGLNILPTPVPPSLLFVYLSQFKSVLVLLLIGAGLISIYLGEIIDAVFVFGIVLLNSVIGFSQEVKARKEIEALKKMVSPQSRVIREGREILIETKYLVPGDIVVLSDGERVPTDGKIFQSKNLTINESVLTGESVPVEKTVGDLVYMSSTVLSGHALVETVAIGADTKFGQIAKELSYVEDEVTPMERQISSLGWRISLLVVGVIVLISWVDILNGRKFSEVFISSVALAVAAIPEGLPAVLTIALAIGVKRLAQKRAVVRKLVAAEALGSVDVICTDKTGTLTKNEMTVSEVSLENGEKLEFTGVGYNLDGKVRGLESIDRDTVSSFARCAILCNTSSLAPIEGNLGFQVLGDTTEGALLIMALKMGISYDEIRSQNPILDEISFDGERKMMTVVTEGEIYTKGAPEKVVPLCSGLGEKEKNEILGLATEWSKRGYRVLGFGSKRNERQTREKWENGLNYLGLVAIFDPPRDEVLSALASAKSAGVRTIMLTGDSVATARAIGEKIGLISQGGEVVSGDQLHEYTDEILTGNLDKISIFARVSPTDKLRIVESLERMGKIVAVTGDGVNDAPALKRADVGVAMGITGTDVSKEAADIIITDDNFSTIVSAIEQGRIIFLNLSKAITYLLSCNLAEVVIILMATLFGLPMPLSPVAILYLNLVTDGLPALALSIDHPSRNVLLKSKSDLGLSKNILSKKSVLRIFLVGVPLGFFAFFVFWILLPAGIVFSRLSVFSLLVFLELVIAVAVRGRGQKIFSNRLLWISLVGGLLFQLVIILTPTLTDLFLIE